MPHKHHPGSGVHFRGSRRARELMDALRKPYYVRKDGELIHVQGRRRFFEVGEVIESPRHLSPSHQAWTLAQLRYEIAEEYSFAGKAKRKRLRDELRMIKQQLREAQRKPSK